MRVGYVSEIGLRDCGKTFSDWVERLVTTSSNESLDFLVVSGGISDNYHVTLSFVEELGRQLKQVNTKLRFIAGNTDFYYPSDEVVVHKHGKFREIMSMYRASEYYLPRNPIITRRVRIVGAESWYDYSLYRGNPVDLKDVTRKRILFFRNRDNDYITDRDDYTLGINNLFDIQYCRECQASLKQTLASYMQKHGACDFSVVVMYFKTNKAFLGTSFVDKYMGTFEGSRVFEDILRKYKVNSCIIGKRFKGRTEACIDGIQYYNSCGDVKVICYD